MLHELITDPEQEEMKEHHKLPQLEHNHEKGEECEDADSEYERELAAAKERYKKEREEAYKSK